MGAPSREQIDETIAAGLAAGDDEDTIFAALTDLHRLSDEELAAIGVVAAPAPVAPADALAEVPPAPEFVPVPVKPRRDGWTVDRQRAFIAALAETGCVSEACADVGITPRSAYRLRLHPRAGAFREAWEQAQTLATARLTALAWDRAVHGTREEYWKDGELAAERRRPNDRLLMWLLTHHHPTSYGWAAKPPAAAPDMTFFRVEHAQAQLAPLVAKLRAVPDGDCPVDPLAPADFDAAVGAPPRA
ncbi:hypothetical protein H8M03_06225 [Sphingomonas sabuli]|uniref:Uncharacterized protein n=1 Tax=Sphingomonas sabuli TaxID=2764186 RepID=A0A7G9L5K2_9SPHN|nr:hypothetical protein [Sphingomonas sabuli]QNM83901.1 hypothetical protein H8M03_06225 [Sphingomonas sabuli]